MKTTSLLFAMGAVVVLASLATGQNASPAARPLRLNADAQRGPQPPPDRYEPTTDFLLKWARSANSERYQYAIDHGVKLTPTPDGRSYVLTWIPQGTASQAPNRKCPPLIVTLHGSRSWAFDEFFLWHRFAAERGFGIVALQWWRGRDSEDYYAPAEMYPLLERTLTDLQVIPGEALLHGFSRGAANCYAVAVIDRRRGRKFFSTIFADSGGYAGDYPPNVAIDRGQYGAAPLTGSHWIMYGGGRDTKPDRDGIPAMRRSGEWVTKQGGEVVLLIADPHGDHGVFHRTPEHVTDVLDAFERQLPR
jgi:hypothetical protein